MNFEELQGIWNNQNTEMVYTINGLALHAYIKRKGGSINRKLILFESIFMVTNLLAAILLAAKFLDTHHLSPQSALSLFYLAFSVFGLIRRLMRHTDEKQFEATLLGDLNKAIWRIDYLIQQGRDIIVWYLLPLILILGVMSFFDGKLLLAAGLLLVATIATYFANRWEINRYHLPNKRQLEILRDTLISHENRSVNGNGDK